MLFPRGWGIWIRTVSVGLQVPPAKGQLRLPQGTSCWTSPWEDYSRHHPACHIQGGSSRTPSPMSPQPQELSQTSHRWLVLLHGCPTPMRPSPRPEGHPGHLFLLPQPRGHQSLTRQLSQSFSNPSPSFHFSAPIHTPKPTTRKQVNPLPPWVTRTVLPTPHQTLHRGPQISFLGPSLTWPLQPEEPSPLKSAFSPKCHHLHEACSDSLHQRHPLS